MLESEARHEAYRDYLVRASAGGTRLIFSELLEVELAEASLGVAGREHDTTSSAHMAARNGYLRTVFSGWEQILDEADYILPIRETHPAQMWEQAFALALDIVAAHNLRMADAVHAATAAILSAPILTDDADFARVPAGLLTIITHPDRAEAMGESR